MALRLSVAFPTGRYEHKEQYKIYDVNDFVADVGGYLGLLLGHSMYSVFAGMTNAAVARKKTE